MALRRVGAVLLALALASVARADQAVAPATVVPPSPLEMPEIPYPEGAVAPAAVVDVEVRLVVAVDGTVREAELVAGAGEPFDGAVLAGVRRFRFTPALVGGHPAEVVLPYLHHFVAPPPPPAPEAVAGPKTDAVLAGLVQERGTRATPAGLAVVARVGGGEFVALTDAEGRFRLPLPAGEAEIRIVDPQHRRFLQRETLAPGEELKVRYLVDRVSYAAYEAVVVATRERTEISRTTLTGRELTKVPGTFGDPFRVVTVLPGVTTLMSLLPYPIVRGSSPGNTGLLLDGVRLPLMYHLFGGPAVVHPELIDRVDFYPGGFPVSYGGYTGGIVDGLTKRAQAAEPRLDLDLSLTTTDVFLRRTVEPLGVTATVAGRLGYPGLLLSTLIPGASLSYWDYQGRLDGAVAGGTWTAFVYGARDEVKATGTGDTAAQEQTLTTVARFQFHHLDLRWRRGDEAFEQSYRVVFGLDESRLGPGSGTGTRFAMPQGRWHAQLAPTLSLNAGAEWSLRRVTTDASGSDAGTSTAQELGGTGTAHVGAAFVEGVWKPREDLVVVPGVRADYYQEGKDHQWNADPRMMLRWRLSDAAVGGTWLKAVVGSYHQPPRFAVPVPGLDQSALSLGLLASQQASVGAEVKLAPGIDLDVQTYFNRMDPVIFDLAVNDDVGTLVHKPPASGPAPPGDGSQVVTDPVGRLFQPRKGRSYGLELMLRRRDVHGFFGWVAYTLSRSERQDADGAWQAFDFDRTHILNAVAGLRLPRNWELGVRLLLQTGTPVTTVSGYNAARTGSQLRFDLRVDKRAVWNRWLLDFYVDVINATVAEESGGLVGGQPLRYVVPTVGFRAVL